MKSRDLPYGTVFQVDYDPNDKLHAFVHLGNGSEVIELKGENHNHLQRQIQRIGHSIEMQRDPIGTVIRDIKTNIFGICC